MTKSKSPEHTPKTNTSLGKEICVRKKKMKNADNNKAIAQ